MNGRNKHGSVFTLLLRNFILFTLLLVFILTVLVVIYFFRMVGILANIDPGKIESYADILSAEQYEDFPAKRLLGDKGFIWVLDAEGKIVYRSLPAWEYPSLSNDDLRCIADYDTASTLEVHNFYTASGEQQTVVSIQGTQNGESIYNEYIWDSKNTLVYQSGDLPMTVLTPKQIALLTDTLIAGHNLQKYSFKTNSGAKQVLLLAADQNAASAAVGQSWRTFFVLLGSAYVLILMLFVLWLNRRIKKPLRLLSHELNRFERGDSSSASYQGPQEFVEIFDSFNGMAERLRHSEEERKQLEQTRQKMLADIAHDLKTPITVVQGYAKALCDGVVPPEEQNKYLSVIEQKAEGLDELINTFYEYSKLEHPEYALILTEQNICNYLRDYVADRYDGLDVSGNLVEADIPEAHILCRIDTVSLARALDNIVNNAVKHNPAGITLFFALQEEATQVRICVADNGVGIPPELRQTIFQPFVVGEASRSYQGSGLGLSITKRIIEAHHGTIRLAKATSPYSTVYEIMLPIQQNE